MLRHSLCAVLCGLVPAVGFAQAPPLPMAMPPQPEAAPMPMTIESPMPETIAPSCTVSPVATGERVGPVRGFFLTLMPKKCYPATSCTVPPPPAPTCAVRERDLCVNRLSTLLARHDASFGCEPTTISRPTHDRACLASLKTLLCWHPDRSAMLPLLVPTPYQSPAREYLGSTACGTCAGGAGRCAGGACGGAIGGGTCAGGACAGGRLPIMGGPLARAKARFSHSKEGHMDMGEPPITPGYRWAKTSEQLQTANSTIPAAEYPVARPIMNP